MEDLTRDLQEHCNTCPYHREEVYRTSEAEKDIIDLQTCYSGIKQDVAELKTGQVLMQQKFDNIRYPIWIIFTAVLIQVAKALITFAPTVTTVVGG